MGAESQAIEGTSDGVLIRVYVTPRSSGNKVVGTHSGEVKIALTAPPVDGAANKALVEFLAKLLGMPKGNVTVASGETSRHKTVRVQGVEQEDVRRKLGMDQSG